jgi:orotate phosphoribosyltransferase
MTADPPPCHDALVGDIEARRRRLAEIVRELGYEHRAEPFTLSSGKLSHDFVDGKRALAAGDNLRLACQLTIDLASHDGIEFDVVGGLTMGADHFAHAIALLAGCEWFVVRKQPKGRGTDQLVEGASLEGKRVLLTEDAVTTGGSIQRAHDVVVDEGGKVVGAMTLIDRGDTGAAFFDDRNIWYCPLLTYRDLGIEPI